MAVQGPKPMSTCQTELRLSGRGLGDVFRRRDGIVAVCPGSSLGLAESVLILSVPVLTSLMCLISLSDLRKPIDFERSSTDIVVIFDCEEFMRCTGKIGVTKVVDVDVVCWSFVGEIGIGDGISSDGCTGVLTESSIVITLCWLGFPLVLDLFKIGFRLVVDWFYIGFRCV